MITDPFPVTPQRVSLRSMIDSNSTILEETCRSLYLSTLFSLVLYYALLRRTEEASQKRGGGPRFGPRRKKGNFRKVGGAFFRRDERKKCNLHARTQPVLFRALHREDELYCSTSFFCHISKKWKKAFLGRGALSKRPALLSLCAACFDFYSGSA